MAHSIDTAVTAVNEIPLPEPGEMDMRDVQLFLERMPKLFAALAESVGRVGERLGSDFPVHPAVPEHLLQLAANSASMEEFTREALRIFITEHAEDLRRQEESQESPNPGFWNVDDIESSGSGHSGGTTPPAGEQPTTTADAGTADDEEEQAEAGGGGGRNGNNDDGGHNGPGDPEGPSEDDDDGEEDDRNRDRPNRLDDDQEGAESNVPKGGIPTPFPEDDESRRRIAGEVIQDLRERAARLIEEDSVEVAQDFEHRLVREIGGLEKSLTGRERDYWYRSGDYSGTKFAMRRWRRSTTLEDRDHEAYLETEIKRRLEARNPGDPPEVVVDLGGARGVTWSREANKFAEQVRAGEVIFVVTNLVNSPRVYDSPNYLEVRDTGDYGPLLERVVDEKLVQFINTTFQALPNATIRWPDGRSVPLAGRATILNDIRSMTLRSYVPELTIPEATKAVRPGGMYLVGGSDVWSAFGREDNPGQMQGIQNAHRALVEKRGFEVEDMPRTAYGWRIFRRTTPREG
jgi:hypothetical protein